MTQANDHAPDAVGGAVQYSSLDPFKVAAQAAGRRTADNLLDLGIQEVDGVRGESCFLIRMPDGSFLAHVEETLGTKNIATQALYALAGDSKLFSHVAIDAARMVLNDVATSGARPLTLAMHLAVGDSAWFGDEHRAAMILAGWEEACHTAKCIFAGGDTPALAGLVTPGHFVLNGSATGFIASDARRIKGDICPGDAIVLIGSTGIHANGLTDARGVAESLPYGYATKLPDGRTYGDAILTPTADYSALVQEVLDHGVPIHYAVNITGHGWRKIMRATEPFVYRIEHVPPVPPELQLIQSVLGYSDAKMYGTFNMGAGFALIVSPRDVPAVVLLARQLQLTAIHGGTVMHQGSAKRVEILPVDVIYEADTLAIR